MGRKNYLNLSKSFRENIDLLDKLPPTAKPVTLKQIENALK